MDATENRLRRLEREAKILRVALVAALVLIGIGAARDKDQVLEEVKTKGLTIVDEEGEFQAGLRAAEGSVHFIMHAGAGLRSVWITADNTGSLVFDMGHTDAVSSPRFTVTIPPGSAPSIVATGKGKAKFAVNLDGQVHALLRDERGNERRIMLTDGARSPKKGK